MKKLILLLSVALILTSCGSIHVLQNSVYDLQNRVSKLEAANESLAKVITYEQQKSESLEKTIYSLQEQVNALTATTKGVTPTNGQSPAPYQSAQSSESSASSTTATTKTYTRTRCQAITKVGTQCKRMAEAGSKYCWQHKR